MSSEGQNYARMVRLSPFLPMHIEHFEKGLRYSDTDLLLIARKIGKMATYCKRLKDEASVIRVEAERRATKKKRDEVKVMITVELPRAIMRADSRKANVLEAFDRAVEKLETQLVRYKETHTGKDRAHRAARSSKRKRTSEEDVSYTLAA